MKPTQLKEWTRRHKAMERFNTMDRFQFRCWDNHLRDMSETFSFGDDEVTFPTFEALPLEAIVVQPKRFFIMQCTGIRDIFGELIFEGDIVENFSLRRKFVVCWESETVGFSVVIVNLYGHKDNNFIALNECSRPEVIGNIYQNPELLG